MIQIQSAEDNLKQLHRHGTYGTSILKSLRNILRVLFDDILRNLNEMSQMSFGIAPFDVGRHFPSNEEMSSKWQLIQNDSTIVNDCSFHPEARVNSVVCRKLSLLQVCQKIYAVLHWARERDCRVALYINCTLHIRVMLIKQVLQSDAMMVLKLSSLMAIMSLEGHKLVSCLWV